MRQSTKYLAVYADEESSHLKALALLQHYLGSLQNTKLWWVQIQHNVCCYHFSSDSSPKFISWLQKTHPRPDPLADFLYVTDWWFKLHIATVPESNITLSLYNESIKSNCIKPLYAFYFLTSLLSTHTITLRSYKTFRSIYKLWVTTNRKRGIMINNRRVYPNKRYYLHLPLNIYSICPCWKPENYYLKSVIEHHFFFLLGKPLTSFMVGKVKDEY